MGDPTRAVLDRYRALLPEVDPDGEMAPCDIRALVVGRGVLPTLPAVVAELLGPVTGASVVLLVDGTLIRREGADVKSTVEALLGADHVVRRAVLDDGHAELHVTEPVVAAAVEAVAGADVVVAVGGGTISDIGKLAVAGTATVLVSVQTAASVDGYTDDVSVLLRDGVKRTVPSRWPDAVVADAETIAEAPAAMNRAGFGEMTSMLVAPADWRLAALVGTERGFRWGPVRLLEHAGRDIASWAPGVAAAQPDDVERLTEALALRGIVSGVAGTTAALSGMEHLVSHMIDLFHGERGLPMGLHGAQVGAAGVVAACTWELLDERLRAGGAALDEAFFDPSAAREKVEATFATLDPTGRIGAECWRDYSIKLATLTTHRARVESVVADWPVHGPELLGLGVRSAPLAAMLTAAGAAVDLAGLVPAVDADLARWAVAGCARMRNRFTVVDLLMLLGWWEDDDVTEVLGRAQAAAGAAHRAPEEIAS